MEFQTLLEQITLKQVVDFIVGVIVVFSTVAEFSKKIPFNPWSFVFSRIGNALTKDLTVKLDEVEKQQRANNDALIELEKKVDKRFDEKQKDDDEKEAKRLRSSIINFADSCRVGQHHTQNNFENVMRDYSDYVGYCEKHTIPNHFIDNEYLYIQGVYQECLEENKFL